MKKFSDKIRAKQKKFFLTIVVGFVAAAAFMIFFMSEEGSTAPVKETEQKIDFDIVSQEVDPEKLRLSELENRNETLISRLESLEQKLGEEKASSEKENQALAAETRGLKDKLQTLEEELKKPEPVKESGKKLTGALKSWERAGKPDEKHVSFEIPAGTVLKAVLVSGADCSVAVQKPTGPNMVLLRPLDNGQLPRNVRVPLKGSVIIGNAIGDISSERVYVRAERLTLVQRGGSFAETEVSAYISGEDGREGMRGVVVDRSGQIVARAAFAAFLHGIGQTTEAILGQQSLQNVAKQTTGQVILDTSKTGALHGSASALNKLSDYYIKRAEQLQPAIQIAAGRVVDVIFTKTVKIGEKDLKKKFEMERAAKRNV